MAFCVYCGKCFTRKEHLERHLVSRTKESIKQARHELIYRLIRYQYHATSMSRLPFTILEKVVRIPISQGMATNISHRDLLKRHCAAYHGQTLTDSIGATSAVKARTAIACKSCAKAKTGCDKKVPCSRCVTKQIECEPRYLRRGIGGHKNPETSNGANSSESTTKPEVVLPKMVDELGGTDFFDSDPSSKTQSTAQEQIDADIFPEPLDKFPDDFQRGDDTLNSEGQCDISDFSSWNDFTFEQFATDNIIAGGGLDSYSLPDPVESIQSPRSSLVTPALTISTSPPIVKSGFLQDQSPSHARALKSNANIIDRWNPHEFQIIIAAEDAWPIACCNAQIFSGVCPRTANFHVKSLQQVCDNEDVWKSFDTAFGQMDTSNIEIVPLSHSTREKIVAITQSFLQKVLAAQMGELHGQSGQSEADTSNRCRFLILPPPNILESFISNYSRNLAVYSSLIPGGSLNVNELMVDSQSSTLLVILMIAQGSTSVSSIEARYLAMGLTEICRLSLFEAIDRNTGLSADFVMLHCAFLFVVLGAWGGDKWHMNIAVGHTPMLILVGGTYLAC